MIYEVTDDQGQKFNVVLQPSLRVICQHQTAVLVLDAEEADRVIGRFNDYCTDCANEIIERSLVMPVELDDPETAKFIRRNLGLTDPLDRDIDTRGPIEMMQQQIADLMMYVNDLAGAILTHRESRNAEGDEDDRELWDALMAHLTDGEDR